MATYTPSTLVLTYILLNIEELYVLNGILNEYPRSQRQTDENQESQLPGNRTLHLENTAHSVGS